MQETDCGSRNAVFILFFFWQKNPNHAEDGKRGLLQLGGGGTKFE